MYLVIHTDYMFMTEHIEEILDNETIRIVDLENGREYQDGLWVEIPDEE